MSVSYDVEFLNIIEGVSMSRVQTTRNFKYKRVIWYMND